MSTLPSRRNMLATLAGGASLAFLLPKESRSQGNGYYPQYNILFAANFGAIGNGTADDTTAIQNALNALGNNGVLQFQAGKTYGISAAGILLSGLSNVRLDFNDCSFIALTNATQQVSDFATYVKLSNCTNCTVQNGTMNGNGYAGAFVGLDSCTDTLVVGNVSYGVSGSGGQFVSNAGVRNVWENNEAINSTGSVRGFWLGGQTAETNITIRNNKAISNGGTGFATGGEGAQIIANYAANNGGAGIETGGPGSNHVVIGNTSTGNTFHGFQTDPTGSATVDGCLISGNLFVNNSCCGILINQALNFTICGNLISSNNLGGATYAEIGILNASVLSITGNTISLPSTAINDAVAVAAPNSVCTDLVVCGNVISSLSSIGACIRVYPEGTSSAIQRATLAGNSLLGCAYGVYVRADSSTAVLTSVNVSGNTISDSATDALYVQATEVGQIGNLSLVGNIGTPVSIDQYTTPAANYGNTWNQAFAAGNTYTAPVPNCNQGLVQEWTLNENCTFYTPINPPLPGNTLTLIVTQSNGGAGVAWNAAYRNPPVWTSGAAESRATAVFIFDGNLWQFVGGSPAFA